MRTALLALALLAAPLAGAVAQTTPPPPPVDRPDGGPGPGRGMGMGGMGGVGALMRADTNGDGIITREEVVASSDAMFDRLDANHDGTVSFDEIRAGRDMMRPAGAPPRGDLGATPPPPPPGAMAAGLTRQQWHDRALRQFDRLDANHDGKVDRTEIVAYQAAMRERRMERRAGDMPPPPPPAAPSGQ